MFQRIVAQIDRELTKTLEHGLLHASLSQLENKGNPIRYNSFALGLRELTRHILARLAPNEAILKCQWYKKETQENNGISRRQRMLYAIKGGLSDDFVRQELGIDLGSGSNKLREAIDRLSKYTHIEEETFHVSANDGDSMVLSTLEALRSFLETVHDFRHDITSAYEERVSESVFEALISDVIPQIDTLATHYWVEDVGVDDITVEAIDEAAIYLNISGQVEVKHQYGSDGDWDRGNGVQFSRLYPIQANINISVKDPLHVVIRQEDVEVDATY